MNGRIAVAVSGAGSNLFALAAAAERGELGGDIALVIADRECPALAWARERGLQAALITGGDDRAVSDALREAAVDVLALAGYMRLIGPATLAAFDGHILNTHPSLLPAFPGAHAVRDALAAGVAVAGATVHLVNEVVDGGSILLQEAVPVLPDDTVETLRTRVQEVEHRLLPKVVRELCAR